MTAPERRLVALLAVLIAAVWAVGYLTQPRCHAEPGRLVVVASCAELDAAGYDGLASCVDASGHLVRPGEAG